MSCADGHGCFASMWTTLRPQPRNLPAILKVIVRTIPGSFRTIPGHDQGTVRAEALLGQAQAGTSSNAWWQPFRSCSNDGEMSLTGRADHMEQAR